MFDAHANLASSLVVTAPTPEASGVTLTIGAGQGSLFPLPPFNCTASPFNTFPTPANSEIIRVTAIVGDTFTILRAQEGTTAKPIVAGWLIANSITVKTITDIEDVVNGYVTEGGDNVFTGDNTFRKTLNVGGADESGRIRLLSVPESSFAPSISIGTPDGLFEVQLRAANTTATRFVTFTDKNGIVALVGDEVRPVSYLVEGLPSAASSEGIIAYVTDANATTRLSVVAGGGSNKLMVFSDGTDWLIM